MARSGGAIQQPPTDTRRRSVASSRFGDRAKVSEGPINEKSKGNSHCVTLWTVGHSTRPLMTSSHFSRLTASGGSSMQGQSRAHGTTLSSTKLNCLCPLRAPEFNTSICLPSAV
jgi:hypothetical protein